MEMMNQDELGRCDFLDVLEEASTLRQEVEVKLRSGESFTDLVQDVVTENHQEFAVFARHGRFPVKDVVACSRAEILHGVYQA